MQTLTAQNSLDRWAIKQALLEAWRRGDDNSLIIYYKILTEEKRQKRNKGVMFSGFSLN